MKGTSRTGKALHMQLHVVILLRLYLVFIPEIKNVLRFCKKKKHYYTAPVVPTFIRVCLLYKSRSLERMRNRLCLMQLSEPSEKTPNNLLLGIYI